MFIPVDKFFHLKRKYSLVAASLDVLFVYARTPRMACEWLEIRHPTCGSSGRCHVMHRNVPRPLQRRRRWCEGDYQWYLMQVSECRATGVKMDGRMNMPRRRLRHVRGSWPERGISNIRQVARIEDRRDIFEKDGEKRHISWKMRE